MKRLIFGDGKISVCNGVQGTVPVLMFEPMEQAHFVGDETHRKAGEQIEASEIEDKFLTFEFHNKESVLVVLEQLLGVYFECLKQEKANERLQRGG